MHWVADMAPSLRVCLAALLVLTFAGSLPRLSAQPAAVYPVRPDSGGPALSLDGNWQFRYLAGSKLGDDAAFHTPAFDASAWSSIAVPGHWELQGFAEPTYAKVDEGTGLYRRTFDVPASWSGQRVFLRFDGVLYGIDVWVNGTEVGSWASAYNAVSFDITDAVKPGADNLLAVKVSTHSHGFDFDLNDCWGLSGIYRDVTVFAVPAVHFTGFTSDTTLQADGSARLEIVASTNRPATGTGQLRTPDGTVVHEFSFSSEAGTILRIAQPHLWTAETPALYTLELALASGQRISETIGLRQVTIVDGVLRLNGRPIKLRGVDHHDLWPEQGRVATEERMRRDLALMRAANINFIRTSHYPPHPRLLELCDELGFYVMDEVPFGFGDAHLTDPSYQEDLFVRARATLQRDRNRASVIIWSVGNENPNTPLTFATGKLVKQLDPSRPICFPQVGSYFGRSHGELPPWVDIYAPHYPVVATVENYAQTLTRPVIFTEYAHALGLATDRIEAQWAVMQASPRLAGGAVWMFQDQGILRASAKPVDRSAPTISAWPDATHYYDTSGNGGMDGIVYSDRTPQTDYWEVRKVYSPVQIAERELAVSTGKNALTLHVENRHDFRSLAGMTLAWSLVRNGSARQSGTVPLRADARQTESVTLDVAVPADAAGDFLALDLRCLNEDGEAFYERSVRLKRPDGIAPLAALQADLSPHSVQVRENAETIEVVQENFSLTLTRQTGEATLCDRAGNVLASGFLPHAGRKFTEAERLRALKHPIWQGALLTAAEPPRIEIRRGDDGVALTVHGRYARPDAAGQFLAGTHTLRIQSNGTMAVDYAYAPEAGSTGDFLEAGFALLTPAADTEFRWAGAGPYAGYPGKEALNEFGLHHLNRDDLYFQGNRRAVEVAALTQADGAGVLIIPAAPADLAVERASDGTVLSHNAILSGRGNKGVGPETNIAAAPGTRIEGRFTLLPLAAVWPARVTAWFGPATTTVKAFQPFYHSYDQ